MQEKGASPWKQSMARQSPTVGLLAEDEVADDDVLQQLQMYIRVHI